MYSRSYYSEAEDRMKPPANYDGTAFIEQKNSEKLDTGATIADKTSETASSESVAASGGGSVLSGLSRTLLGGLFDGGRLNLRLPKMGTEEILILATAAFLFFSKEGDTECAVLLLLLLLIN